MGKERIKNFLSNYKFQSNNIEFRIVSSKAMEKFKNVQSFQLGQLVNGKFFFAQERRELLLLEYDIITRWLTEIESSIIAQSRVDINLVIGLAYKCSEQIKNTIDQNPIKFDTVFTNIYRKSHNYLFKKMLYLIDRLDSSNVDKFYTGLVDLVISIMDHSLVEIHELNNILNNDKIYNTEDGKMILDYVPTIYITNISVECFETYGCSLTKSRIMSYKESFNFEHITIKNFSECKIPKEMLNDIETVVEIDYKGSIQ